MRNTIKKHADFVSSDADINARSEFFYVRARPAKIADDARYGVMVTKRIFKLAVDRNRAKRLLRDWIRHSEKHMHPGLDYIFLARHRILAASRPDGRAAMRRALNYVKKQYDKNTPKK